MAPPPLPEDLLELWMKHEFFKRNPAEIAYKTVILLMNNIEEKVKDEVISAWRPEEQPGPSRKRTGPSGENSEEGPKSKVKKRGDSSSEGNSKKELEPAEEPMDEYADAPVDELSDDDSVISISTGGSPMKFEDFDEVETEIRRPMKHIRELSDTILGPGYDEIQFKFGGSIFDYINKTFPLFDDSLFQNYPLMTVKQLYSRFAKEELDGFRNNWSQGESVKEADIFQMLGNQVLYRYYGPYLSPEAIDFFKISIKKLQVTVGFGKTNVILQTDQANLYLHFLYHEDGCLAWKNDFARIIERTTYHERAAQNVFALMSFHKRRIKELIFDVEPYTKGLKVYPHMEFFYELNGVRKNWPLIKASRLFFTNSRGPKKRDDLLPNVLRLLDKKYFKLITLRVWKDSELIDKEQQDLQVNSSMWKYHPEYMLTVFEKSIVDIQDERVNQCKWTQWDAFRCVIMVRVDAEVIYHIIRLLRKHPPTRETVVCTKEPMNMRELKKALRIFTDEKNINIGSISKFPSKDKTSNITMNFQRRKIVISSERISGAVTPDTISPSSSEGSECFEDAISDGSPQNSSSGESDASENAAPIAFREDPIVQNEVIQERSSGESVVPEDPTN